METLRVVVEGCGEALQAHGGGVVVGALVTEFGQIKRVGLSGMAVLRRPECEPVTVVVFGDGGAAVDAVGVHKRGSLKTSAVSVAVH